ncbi:MAG TPA: pyridoxal-phosphate dependent enzyme [Thermoanaerobaculia bacterium]|nr:pyridoxal-phosphate dependent enzyme [Thermoanaerobaculia bacterium]
MASVEAPRDPWPIRFADVLAAERRIRPHVAPTPLRRYAPLDGEVGRGIGVWVKHENHAPTNSFKVRNALSAMTLLSDAERRRGVVAATRGNHGLGLALAGELLGVRVAICVPVGNNPEKNAGIVGYGAELVEEGPDYDASVLVAERLVRERGMTFVHSTNDRGVIAGAATLTLEMLRERPELEAIVYAIGGGSQAVGGMTVARTLKPSLEVYGVQAAGASAAHDSWHEGHPRTTASARTIADGLATRSTYPATFEALREGLRDFVKVSDGEIAEAMRLLLRTTHNLAEGAGAAGLAGLFALGDRLAGRRVGVVLSGGNVDRATLASVVHGQI